MSNWHQFDVRQFDLRDADVELRDLYKQTFRWLKANAVGKWKITRLRRGGVKKIPIKTFLKFSPMTDDRIIVSLKKERDVTLFKMFFGDYFRFVSEAVKLGQILLPMIRRVMPTVIAHDLLGVQPMTGALNGLAALRVKYVDQKSPNSIYSNMSPSKRRALRRRLRKAGGSGLLHIDDLRPKGQPVSKRATMAAILENTRRELLHGR